MKAAQRQTMRSSHLKAKPQKETKVSRGKKEKGQNAAQARETGGRTLLTGLSDTAARGRRWQRRYRHAKKLMSIVKKVL